MQIIKMLLVLLPLMASSVFAREIAVDLDLGKGATTDDWYQMAIWLANKDGKYLKTLYVTHDVGIEGLGNKYKTLFGLTIREEKGSLPVWAYARNVLTEGNPYPPKTKPLPDSMTGATIKNNHWIKNFNLSDKLADKAYYCFIEINVSQDSTPSMVYRAVLPNGNNVTRFKFVGAGDEKGRNGTIYQLDKKFSPKNFVSSANISG